MIYGCVSKGGIYPYGLPFDQVELVVTIRRGKVTRIYRNITHASWGRLNMADIRICEHIMGHFVHILARPK